MERKKIGVLGAGTWGMALARILCNAGNSVLVWSAIGEEIDMLTETSRHSRNNRAGFLIGKGYTPEEAVKEVGMVVEGINALPAAVRLAAQYGVEMPIVSFMDGVIRCGTDPGEAAAQLMGRRRKSEMPAGDREHYFAQLLAEAIRSGNLSVK